MILMHPPGADADDIGVRHQSTHLLGARRTIALILLLTAPISAQTPGSASFVVYENGEQIGWLQTNLVRADDGWRLRSSMRTSGSTPVSIVNLDLHYDRRWFPRFMTMETKEPDDVIVHVAVVKVTAQVDTVRSREARFRSYSVSPNTLLLPEHAYGAYEALAARLANDPGATDVPMFVPPTGETRATIDLVGTERVNTARGPLVTTHYVLTEIWDRPTRVDLWVVNGRLLRLEFPRTGVAVLRSDLTERAPGPRASSLPPEPSGPGDLSLSW